MTAPAIVIQFLDRIDGAFPLDDVLAEPFKEQGFVLVIEEDARFIYSANHDVVQGAGNVQAGLTRHEATLPDFLEDVKYYTTWDTTSPIIPHKPLEEINWKQAVKDVSPFLERPQDVTLLTLENAISLLLNLKENREW